MASTGICTHVVQAYTHKVINKNKPWEEKNRSCLKEIKKVAKKEDAVAEKAASLIDYMGCPQGLGDNYLMVFMHLVSMLSPTRAPGRSVGAFGKPLAVARVHIGHVILSVHINL